MEAKKILIFGNSIDQVSLMYEWAVDKLERRGSLYVDESSKGDIESRLVDMYHSHLDNDTEERVRTTFGKRECNIRLLFSTIKMGMGVDIPDIDICVLFGVPSTSVELWQESGRCARSAVVNGFVFIYATAFSLRNCEDGICKKLGDVDYTSCYRQAILDAFRLTGMAHVGVKDRNMCTGQCSNICLCEFCKCCNNCAKLCPCPFAYIDILKFITHV